MCEVRCKGCHKRPDELPEYLIYAKQDKMTPEEYVKQEEGTYNEETGAFWCTECYVYACMPLGRA